MADHTFSGLLGVFPGGSLRQHSASLRFAAAVPGKRSGSFIKEKTTPAQRDGVALQEPLYVYPRTSGGFIAREVSKKRIYFVDSNGFLERQYIQIGSIFEDPAGREVTLKGMKRAVPVKAGVFTLAEIEDWKGKRQTTFAYLDRMSRRYVPVDVESAFSDASDSLAGLRPIFYHLDFPYLAVADDVVYALIMEQHPWVAQVDLGDTGLKALRFQRLDLSDSLGQYEKPSRTKEDIQALARALGGRQAAIDWMFESYRAIEMQKVPIGLVAWNDSVWIVSKSAMGSDGKTAWKLTELVGESGRRFGRRIELPAEGGHVAIIPGDEYFALLEKGGVETLDLRAGRILYRSTESARLFPVSWLSSTSPSDTKVQCKRILDD